MQCIQFFKWYYHFWSLEEVWWFFFCILALTEPHMAGSFYFSPSSLFWWCEVKELGLFMLLAGLANVPRTVLIPALKVTRVPTCFHFLLYQQLIVSHCRRRWSWFGWTKQLHLFWEKKHGPDLEVHLELYNDIKSPQWAHWASEDEGLTINLNVPVELSGYSACVCWNPFGFSCSV